MNASCVRIASCLLFLSCLPVAAQTVRYDQNGQAYTMDVVQSRAENAILRGVIGLPPQDRGQVVFFRPARVGDPATPLAIQERNATLHNLPADSFAVAAATPGTHAYRLQGGSAELVLDVRPGHTYFVRIGTTRDATRIMRSDAIGMLDAARGHHEALY